MSRRAGLLRSIVFCCLCLLHASRAASAEDGEWGHLSGRFVYDGEVPTSKPLEVTRDSDTFGKTVEDDSLIVHKENKGIANVVVYLLPEKDRALRTHPSYDQDAEAKIGLEVSRGRWSPRVLLMRTTQTLAERNRDPVGHNAYLQLMANPPRNTLIFGDRAVEHRFQAEERIPQMVACNIHPWERAFVLVRANPYMAKSDLDGKFDIKNLPVGEHTFQVWHERTGYVRDVRCGPIATNSKGRFSVTIRAGAQTTLNAAVPGSRFEAQSP